ncbi:sodium:solute symporter [Bullifex porci]|uniref:sodium:solute symporter family protein n=1 Tax=Bullifex porci TaxID=2606638 RepID=UPI0023F28D90|nr:sodium:solute symporter family protein [Bullifex porci]MDD7255991.1 sodium:solute symporter family protein [Bullifex porci]MDY2740188.1 sodium:solute symporter family protein [Bullifex porci]
MVVNTGAIIIVICYLVGMLVIGAIVGKLKIKNSEDYMVAGRRMGLFMVAFSLSANNIGGGSTTGLAGKAFGAWGMSAIWYVLAASIAMIPLAFFAPKIRKTLAVTIPEVIGRRFGKSSSIFSAILNIIALFCLTSSQVAASGSVVSALTGIPMNVCLILAGIVIILYTTLGGMIADQISDLVQFIIIFIGLAIATPFVINGIGGWQALSAKLPAAQLSPTKIGWVVIIGYIFNYFCTFLSGPEMISRFESAKDEKTAFRASLLSGVLMAAMAIFPTLLGLAALAVKDSLPNVVASNAMMSVTSKFAPTFITGLVSAAIISATMSSADSNLLCMSTMAMNDIIKPYTKLIVDDKKSILYTRSLNVVFCAIAMAISMFNINIVTMNTFAFAIRCAGPFAAYGLGLIIPRATKHSGQISIITGTIGVIFWQILSGGDFFLGILPVVFGCAVGTVTFFIINLIEWKMGVESAPSAYIDEK